MTLYLDSSVVVALLTNEPHSLRAEAWVAACQEGIALSRWVETEVAAAISAKVRIGGFDDRLIDETRSALTRFMRSARRLTIGTRHFELAIQFAAVADAKLRGGDALHLAIASETGSRLCTLDRRQFDAGAVLGVPVELL